MPRVRGERFAKAARGIVLCECVADAWSLAINREQAFVHRAVVVAAQADAVAEVKADLRVGVNREQVRRFEDLRDANRTDGAPVVEVARHSTVGVAP